MRRRSFRELRSDTAGRDEEVAWDVEFHRTYQTDGILSKFDKAVFEGKLRGRFLSGLYGGGGAAVLEVQDGKILWEGMPDEGLEGGS